MQLAPFIAYMQNSSLSQYHTLTPHLPNSLIWRNNTRPHLRPSAHFATHKINCHPQCYRLSRWTFFSVLYRRTKHASLVVHEVCCHIAKLCISHSFRSLSYDRSIASSKRVLHRVQFNAFSFNFQYPLFALRSSSSCLCLLPRLPITCILPSTFPSIKCFRRQFLHKMWPIQLAFLLFIARWLFLSS